MLQAAHYILKASEGEVTVDVANRGATFRDEQDRSVTIPLKSYRDGFNWDWGEACRRCWAGVLRRISILEGRAVMLKCTNCRFELRWEAGVARPMAARRRGNPRRIA